MEIIWKVVISDLGETLLKILNALRIQRIKSQLVKYYLPNKEINTMSLNRKRKQKKKINGGPIKSDITKKDKTYWFLVLIVLFLIIIFLLLLKFVGFYYIE